MHKRTVKKSVFNYQYFTLYSLHMTTHMHFRPHSCHGSTYRIARFIFLTHSSAIMLLLAILVENQTVRDVIR